jgi:uncharacterized membrane protein HdeD (DUF308 family)
VKKEPKRRVVAGGLVILLACLALAAPFVFGTVAHFVLGLLMFGMGLTELCYGFGTRDRRQGLSVFLGSGMSIVIGVLLTALPKLAAQSQALLLGLSFAIDGLTRMLTAVRSRDKAGWGARAIDGLFSVLLGFFIAIQWPVTGIVVIGLTVGLRMLSAGWSMLLGRAEAPTISQEDAALLHPDSRMGLPPHEELARFRQSMLAAEEGWRWINRYWCITFIIVFFAIHVGRMDVEWNLVGLLSPGIATLGDMGFALLLAWCIIIPGRMVWREITRPLERRCWKRLLKSSLPESSPCNGATEQAGDGATRDGSSIASSPRRPVTRSYFARMLRPWLTVRYRFSARLQRSRRSPTTAFGWGLQIGLPLTAVLIALHPIWGMTWYFNSENWVTGAWEKWTEYRVDDWRAAMIREIRATAVGVPEGELFRVAPEGVAGNADFSFIVIGDTGEGDESQHILRDRFLLLGQRPDVRFLIVSSDVIYPSGAMKDYESKFYLPFKGFTKPIYGLPGNHDWYDALDAFAPNFLEPAAARAALRARRAADKGLTTTTEAKVERLIAEAARLRKAYGAQTGLQRAPFFEIQTDRFALIVVDTGILKIIDDEQQAWLNGALERSRGKFKMALLGHPLYAEGHDKGVDNPRFAALHQLMRDHEVEVVMAGDTHSLEYYREKYRASGSQDGKENVMHHFVNGGGGAYLSIGTQLNWPGQPAVADCGYYPRTEAIVDKLDRETPGWKWPIWFWVKRFGAWPSTPETLAAVFNYNHAPFYQSFVEVRVEYSANVVRFIPHGVSGPLRWRDFQLFGQVIPSGRNEDDIVEFTVPMSTPGP